MRYRKRYLFLSIVPVVFMMSIFCSAKVTAIPAPRLTPAATNTAPVTPLPSPTQEAGHYQWAMGQSGYFLCEGGWYDEFYGQSFFQECLLPSGHVPAPVTPEPGHYLWAGGQRGYFLCEGEWYTENYGQAVFRQCTSGD